MTISWPPYGRWAAGYGTDQEALAWVPKTQVAGKVGYAMPPGGHPQLAAGFALSIASGSKKKDPAYLFIQWLNSQEISLQRVQLPYALRDPFRDDHFTSRSTRALAGGARVPRGAAGRGGQRAARPFGHPDRQVRGGAAGHLQALGRRGPAGDPRRGRGAVGRDHRADRRRQAACRLRGVGREAQRLPDRGVSRHGARPRGRAPVAASPTGGVGDHAGGGDDPADRPVPDRLPAVVSFQNINMLEEDTRSAG